MKTQIKTLEVVNEAGNAIEIGVVSGVFGAWCAVRDSKKIGMTTIRPLQWIEDFSKDPNS